MAAHILARDALASSVCKDIFLFDVISIIHNVITHDLVSQVKFFFFSEYQSLNNNQHILEVIGVKRLAQLMRESEKLS